MKKLSIFVMILILAIIVFASIQEAGTYSGHENSVSYILSAEAREQKNYINTNNHSSLPSSLCVIEDGSFEGTAIRSIKLPDSVVSIGDYAFANIHSLIKISIPQATTRISSSAFTGSGKVSGKIIITAPSNSYARRYAEENNLLYSPFIAIYAGTDHSSADLCMEGKLRETTVSDAFSRFEADAFLRTLDEEKTTAYILLIGNIIQSRAPPFRRIEVMI